jgi:hypothetical protein
MQTLFLMKVKHAKFLVFFYRIKKLNCVSFCTTSKLQAASCKLQAASKPIAYVDSRTCVKTEMEMPSQSRKQNDIQ